jgi:hypothetical protein
LEQIPPDPMFDFSSQNAMTNPGFETPSLLQKWGSFQNEMDSLFENLLAHMER